MNNQSKYTGILLFAVLLLASILRLIHPFDIPYTGDEFNALLRTHFSSFSELITKGVIVDAHPAGVQVFLYYWTKLFGYSEIAVKLPFILCGILAVLYIFLIGKEWFNSTVGLICAAFLATLQYTVMYSQIARPYSSGLFFTLAMVYYWSKIIFKPEERSFYRNCALYILFSAACAYNHYFSLLVAAMVGLTGLLFISRKNIVKYVMIGIIIFILYIPHLHIFFYQFGIGGIDKQLAKPTNNFILEYLNYVFHFSAFIFFTVGVLFLFGIVHTIRNKIRVGTYQFISLCWFLIPFLVGFFYSRYLHSVLQYSVLIFSFPFLLLFLFGWLPELSGKVKIFLIFIICSINTISLLVERDYYSIFYTSRYEQIVLKSNSVNNNINPDSCISLLQSSAELPEDYYIKKDHIDTSSFHFINNSPKKQPIIQFIEQQHKPYLSWGALASADPVYIALFLNYYPFIIKQCNFYGGTFYLFSSHPGKVFSPYIFQDADDFKNPGPFWSATDKSFLSDSISLAGKSSYKMDSLHEWGPGFTCSLEKIISNHHTSIYVSVELLPLETLNDVFIVSTFESGGKTIDWRSTPVNDFTITYTTPKWQKAYHAIRLSDIDINYPNVTAKIYIWNKGKKNFYLNSFEIKTIEDNPILYGLFEKI